MERLNIQARVARELTQLEQDFVKVNQLYSLITKFEVCVVPEEMALYQTLMPSFQNLKVSTEVLHVMKCFMLQNVAYYKMLHVTKFCGELRRYAIV